MAAEIGAMFDILKQAVVVALGDSQNERVSALEQRLRAQEEELQRLRSKVQDLKRMVHMDTMDCRAIARVVLHTMYVKAADQSEEARNAQQHDDEAREVLGIQAPLLLSTCGRGPNAKVQKQEGQEPDKSAVRAVEEGALRDGMGSPDPGQQPS